MGTVCFVLKGPYITRIETGWLEGRTVKCSVLRTAGSGPPYSESVGEKSSEDDAEDVAEVDVDPACGERRKNPPSFGSKCISTAET